ncbi:MAG: hypothetical protein ACREGB_03235 [Candidatus Saccharimonadales bacterium]
MNKSVFNRALPIFAVSVLLLSMIGVASYSAAGALPASYSDTSASEARHTGNSVVQGPLELTLSTNKSHYGLSDSIQFQVFLVNRSRSPIYLYRLLCCWGALSSVSLLVKNVATGDTINGKFVTEELPPPPSSKADFIRLDPGYLYGSRATIKVSNLNIQKSGTYDFLVRYHSPIPASMNFGLPIWNSEMGVISSNSVAISIGGQ